MALVIPSAHRTADDAQPTGVRNEAEAAATAAYAHSLNAAFAAREYGETAAAALLSLHTLLALDPHGHCVQPHPDLLFYTPAGFSAAVSKVWMQHVMGCTWQSQAGQQQNGAQQQNGTQEQDGTQQQDEQDEQAQQQQQQRAETGSQPAGTMSGGEHDAPQQGAVSWCQQALPEWYVWWHLGLVAYHEQQQQGPQGTARCSSSGSGTPGVSMRSLYTNPAARWAR
jgi:hypothetical protein